MPFFTFLFHAGCQDGTKPTHAGADLFHGVLKQMCVHPFWKHLTDTLRVTFYQLPGQPVGQASSHIILTTTGQDQE